MSKAGARSARDKGRRKTEQSARFPRALLGPGFVNDNNKMVIIIRQVPF